MNTDHLWPVPEPSDYLPPEWFIEDPASLPQPSLIGTEVVIEVAGRQCRGVITDEREWSRTTHVLVKPRAGFTCEKWVCVNCIVSYIWDINTAA